MIDAVLAAPGRTLSTTAADTRAIGLRCLLVLAVMC